MTGGLVTRPLDASGAPWSVESTTTKGEQAVRDWNVTYRLTAPALLLSAFLFIVQLLGAFHLLEIQRKTAELLVGDVAEVRAAEELAVAVREVELRVYRFLVSGDRKHLESLREQRNTTQRWSLEIARLADTRPEHDLIEQLGVAETRFWGQVEQLIAAPDRQGQAAVELGAEVLRLTQEYLDLNEERLAGAVAGNQSLFTELAVMLVVLGTCGAVAGVLLGIGVVRGVRKKLFELSVPIYDAAGKLGAIVGPLQLPNRPTVEQIQEALAEVASKVGLVIERLEESRREALRAEQLAALGHLSSGLAHELRNPLTAMKILIQADLAREGSPGMGTRHLLVLEEELDRLDRLVTRFLDFARPPSLQTTRLDLDALVHQVLDFLSPQAALRRVTIERTGVDGPLEIEGDSEQLRQLLLNIVLNAIEACREGGTVTVRLDHDLTSDSARGGAPGPSTVLEIEDDGPGFPPEVVGRVFEPFVSTKDTGMGLGLPICRQIVEDHGGAIEATNRTGGGARVVVRLPDAPVRAIA